MTNALVVALGDVIARAASVADDSRIDYRSIALYLGGAQQLFELYVQARQVRQYDRTTPPPVLKQHLSKETFRKAQAYGRDKIRYTFAHTIFEWAMSIFMIKFGVYAWAWEASGGVMARVGVDASRTIVHSLIWVTMLTAFSSLTDLPWSYYYTFVLEEEHGFNKSTKRLFFVDKVKGYALGAVIGLPFFAGFLRIIELAGKNFVPWLMLFIIVVQLGLQIIYPILIQPLFNKFTPVPEGEVRTRVENLAKQLDFPLKHLYVIDGSKRSSHSNAYFYGLPWSKRIVLYDTLLESSTPAQVEAVLAHELGHWYHWHPTRLLLVAEGHLFFTLTLFSVFIHNKALFASFGFDPKLAIPTAPGSTSGGQPIVIGFILYQLLFDPLDTFVKFFMNSRTRAYEYQADEFALRLDKGKDLAAALIKLHVDNLSSPYSDKLYSMYHHSHPTLPERLTAMEDYTGTNWLKKSESAKQREEEIKEKKTE